MRRMRRLRRSGGAWYCVSRQGTQAPMNKLFAELRRRNIFRVAGLYAVVSWLIAQAAGVLENALAMPRWFDTVIVSALLLGFPIALVLAWAFELTPDGVKLTANVPEDASIAPKTGRRLDAFLVGALALLIVVIVGDRLIPDRPAPVETAAARPPQGEEAGGPHPEAAVSKDAAADSSIAVLPFADMSAAKDQEYFADGISEELLNVLAQVRGLQVAGRTSSFAFKNDNRDLREIGQLLNVSHILEGSVRKAGDKVRITAQLVKANDGFHLWSATYDRQLTDIFAVQDEIAGAILDEMTPFLPASAVAASVAPAKRADIGAYDLFLLAREKMTQDGSRAAYEQSVMLLDDAIAQDPDYAPALAWRSYAESMLSEADGGVGTKPMAEALPVIKEYADRALAADPKSAEALFAVGSYWGQRGFADDLAYFDQAIQYLRQAVAVRPNFPQAQNDLAYFLDQTGANSEAIAILSAVLAHDPGLRDANVTYIYGQSARGNHDEAEAALTRWLALRPDSADAKGMRVVLLNRRARLADAIRAGEALKDVADGGRLQRQLAWVRLRLHDKEWLDANAPTGFAGLSALLAGDRERAARLAEADPYLRATTYRALQSYVPRQYAAGKIDAVVAYYEQALKTPAAAVEAWNSCDCSLTSLAAALKAAGHNDYPELMRLWKERGDKDRAAYANSGEFNQAEADRAALEGDFALAKKLYARAMDLGWRNSFFIHDEYVTILPQDADIDALQARMRGLINEEREKLGMGLIKNAR